MSGTTIITPTPSAAETAAASKRLADAIEAAHGAGLDLGALADAIERHTRAYTEAGEITPEQMKDPAWLRANQHRVVLAMRAGKLRNTGAIG